ncbi:P-II family nitrogen regulator [Desulfurobacterium sp.]
MKEVIAIIRPGYTAETKRALEEAGYPSMTIIPVEGRGKQGGLTCDILDIDPYLADEKERIAATYCTSTKKLIPTDPKYALESDSTITRPVPWLPKKLISIVVPTEADAEKVAAVIISVNRTGKMGDGKIFICPVEEAIQIRTGKRGEEAI